MNVNLNGFLLYFSYSNPNVDASVDGMSQHLLFFWLTVSSSLTSENFRLREKLDEADENVGDGDAEVAGVSGVESVESFGRALPRRLARMFGCGRGAGEGASMLDSLVEFDDEPDVEALGFRNFSGSGRPLIIKKCRKRSAERFGLSMITGPSVFFFFCTAPDLAARRSLFRLGAGEAGLRASVLEMLRIARFFGEALSTSSMTRFCASALGVRAPNLEIFRITRLMLPASVFSVGRFLTIVDGGVRGMFCVRPACTGVCVCACVLILFLGLPSNSNPVLFL